MADVDTENKRRGATGMLFFPLPSVPDGTVAVADRKLATGIYGFVFAIPGGALKAVKGFLLGVY